MPPTPIHQLDHYIIDHETLEALLEISGKAIQRLRTSPAEEARAVGTELEEVWLDLQGAMHTCCHRVELWGETMEPPPPRQVEPANLLHLRPPTALSGASEG